GPRNRPARGRAAPAEVPRPARHRPGRRAAPLAARPPAERGRDRGGAGPAPPASGDGRGPRRPAGLGGQGPRRAGVAARGAGPRRLRVALRLRGGAQRLTPRTPPAGPSPPGGGPAWFPEDRSEEHTSELQSRE